MSVIRLNRWHRCLNIILLLLGLSSLIKWQVHGGVKVLQKHTRYMSRWVIIKEKTLQFDWSFSQERQIFKEPVCRGFILKSLSLSAFIRAE